MHMFLTMPIIKKQNKKELLVLVSVGWSENRFLKEMQKKCSGDCEKRLNIKWPFRAKVELCYRVRRAKHAGMFYKTSDHISHSSLLHIIDFFLVFSDSIVEISHITGNRHTSDEGWILFMLKKRILLILISCLSQMWCTFSFLHPIKRNTFTNHSNINIANCGSICESSDFNFWIKSDSHQSNDPQPYYIVLGCEFVWFSVYLCWNWQT